MHPGRRRGIPLHLFDLPERYRVCTSRDVYFAQRQPPQRASCPPRVRTVAAALLFVGTGTIQKAQHRVLEARRLAAVRAAPLGAHKLAAL